MCSKNLSINAWINIDKPVGMSSAHIVARVKRFLKAKKVGHAGTLDPFASGVLPIAINEATKTASFVQSDVKEYEFIVHFGIKTSTGDTEGEVIDRTHNIPTSDEIVEVLHEFEGEIEQTPSAYSAIKINGKRAYQLVRSGEKVEMKPRIVRIDILKLINFDKKTDKALFRVRCGKGTYVRSLGEDIAEKLGSLGYLAQLRRTEVGVFCKKNIIPLEKMEKLVHNDLLDKHLLSILEVLSSVETLDFVESDAHKVLDGVKVEVNKLTSERSFVLAKFLNVPLAIGKIDNSYFSPIRVFNLLNRRT